MKLFHAPISPYARKVRVLIAEYGLGDIAQEAVMPLSAPDYGDRVNPMGKVPALILDDGSTLFDSPLICEYLSVLAGKWVGPDDPQFWPQKRAEALGDGVMDAAVNARFEVMRPEAQQSPLWLERWNAAINRGLSQMNADIAQLGPTGRHEIGLGQISFACALAYLDFRHAHLDWRTGNPALAAWYEIFSQRPAMAATAPPV